MDPLDATVPEKEARGTSTCSNLQNLYTARAPEESPQLGRADLHTITDSMGITSSTSSSLSRGLCSFRSRPLAPLCECIPATGVSSALALSQSVLTALITASVATLADHTIASWTLVGLSPPQPWPPQRSPPAPSFAQVHAAGRGSGRLASTQRTEGGAPSRALHARLYVPWRGRGRA